MPVNSLPKPSAAQSPQSTAKPESVSPQITIQTISVEMPFIAKTNQVDYQDESHRVDLGRLTREQLKKVKALRRGLVARGDHLADGREIKSNRDALLWAIESLPV